MAVVVVPILARASVQLFRMQIQKKQGESLLLCCCPFSLRGPTTRRLM